MFCFAVTVGFAVKSLKYTHVNVAMSVHPSACKALGILEQIFMKFGIGKCY
jgi:hypothetical protein